MASNKEKFYKRQLKQGKIDAAQFAKIMGTAPKITEKNKGNERVQMFNRYGSDPSLRQKGTSVKQWATTQENALQQRLASQRAARLSAQEKAQADQFIASQQRDLQGNVLLPSQQLPTQDIQGNVLLPSQMQAQRPALAPQEQQQADNFIRDYLKQRDVQGNVLLPSQAKQEPGFLSSLGIGIAKQGANLIDLMNQRPAVQLNDLIRGNEPSDLGKINVLGEQIQSPISKLNEAARTGKPMTGKERAGYLGETALDVASFMPVEKALGILAKGASPLKSAALKKIASVIGEGAAVGGALTPAYGVTSGLQQNQSAGEIASNVPREALYGAAGGAAASAGLFGLGKLFGAASSGVRRALKAPEKEVSPAISADRQAALDYVDSKRGKAPEAKPTPKPSVGEAKGTPEVKQKVDIKKEVDTARKYQEDMIDAVAKEQRSIEESLQGGYTMDRVPGEKGYEPYGGSLNLKKGTDHGQRYRQYFKETGKKPPLYKYKEWAKQDLEFGNHPKADEYKAVNDYISQFEKTPKETDILDQISFRKKDTGQDFGNDVASYAKRRAAFELELNRLENEFILKGKEQLRTAVTNKGDKIERAQMLNDADKLLDAEFESRRNDLNKKYFGENRSVSFREAKPSLEEEAKKYKSAEDAISSKVKITKFGQYEKLGNRPIDNYAIFEGGGRIEYRETPKEIIISGLGNQGGVKGEATAAVKGLIEKAKQDGKIVKAEMTHVPGTPGSKGYWNGYLGFKSDGKGNSILDPSKQFTDIWNKAKGTSFREGETKLGKADVERIFNQNKKYFGDKAVEIVQKIKENEKALGMHREGIISILDGKADALDTYNHEAVHKYFSVFMDREDAADLIMAAQKKYGGSFSHAEEKMAEDFINYAKRGEGVTGKVKVAFDKVLEKIKSYIGNEDKIKATYADLYSGKAKGVSQRRQKALLPEKLPQGQKKTGQQNLRGLNIQSYESKLAQNDKNVKLGERSFIQNIKKSSQVSQETKDVIKEQFYNVRNTQELSVKAKNLVRDNIEAAEQLARTGVDDKAVATQAELIKHYSDLAGKAATEAEKNVFLDRAADIAGIAAENLTESGRAIQAATIMGRMTPEGALRFAQGIIKKHNATVKGPKIPNLTPEQTGTIIDRMKEIKLIMDPKEKAKAVYELNNYISDLVPSTLGQKIVQVWKAGLLTGVKTSGVNITSNIVHGVNEAAKDVPAAIVDKVIGLFTGKRTKTASIEGFMSGGKEGTLKGWDYLKTGFDERNAGLKYDMRRVNFGKGKIAKSLQKYSEGVFRLIGSEDQPFYYAAKARSLFEQAKVEAINKGLKGEAFESFVKNAVENPTDEMIKLAAADAEVATFTNKNVLGEAASALTRKLGTTGEVIMPFRNTPSNVAIQAINYSPVGIVKTILENIGKGKFNQRAFSEGIGRGVVGTIEGFAVGSALFGAGMMTLDAPKTEKERNQWELEGKKPNSVLIDGKWRSLGSLGPIGVSMLTAGHYQQALEEKGSPVAAMSSMLTGTAKSLVDQTFLKGVSGVINAINDPLRFGETLAENTAGSAIPTIVGDAARASDEYQREIKGIPSALKGRIPGLRETLPEKVDVLGNKLKEEGAVAVMVDVFRSSTQRNQNDPVVKELGRLTSEGESGTPIDFKAKQKINGEDVEIDQAKVNEVKTFIGEQGYPLFKELMDSQYYKDLPDAKKANLIDSITADLRGLAKHDILGDNGKYTTVQDIKDDIKARKTYGKVSSLMEQGRKEEAYNIIDSLSDEEKKLFNSVKTQEKPDWQPKKEEVKVNKDKFNEVYDLMKQEKTAEAEKIVADMTDAEYEDFKSARSAKRKSNTATFKERLGIDPKLAVSYAKSLPKAEAQRIIDSLTDEEYDTYLSGK